MRWILLLELPRICGSLGTSFNLDAIKIAHDALFELDEFLLIAAIDCIEHLLRNGVYKNVNAESNLNVYDFLLLHPAFEVRNSMVHMIMTAKELSIMHGSNMWWQFACRISGEDNTTCGRSDFAIDVLRLHFEPVSYSAYDVAKLELMHSADYSMTRERFTPSVLSFYVDKPSQGRSLIDPESSMASSHSIILGRYMDKVAIRLKNMSFTTPFENEDYVGGGYFRSCLNANNTYDH